MSFLQYLSLIDAKIFTYIIGAVLVITLALIMRLEVKFRRLLVGKNAKSIEDSIVAMHTEVKDFVSFRKEMEAYLMKVEKRLQKNVAVVETVRFNPFKGDGIGGNQSFATVFVNEQGDGVIVSSLYGREKVSVFAKPLKKLQSEYELSGEEKEALNKAREALGNTTKK